MPKAPNLVGENDPMFERQVGIGAWLDRYESSDDRAANDQNSNQRVRGTTQHGALQAGPIGSQTTLRIGAVNPSVHGVVSKRPRQRVEERTPLHRIRIADVGRRGVPRHRATGPIIPQ